MVDHVVTRRFDIGNEVLFQFEAGVITAERDGRHDCKVYGRTCLGSRTCQQSQLVHQSSSALAKFNSESTTQARLPMPLS